MADDFESAIHNGLHNDRHILGANKAIIEKDPFCEKNMMQIMDRIGQTAD